jgi:DNA-binding transcriptional LysR family regulator
MMQSLELMSKFHAMCECDTWEEISRKLNQTRADVEAVVSELEFVLGKKLIHRRDDGDVVSNFSSRFFMPTDSGMKWYLLIGELLRGLGDASSPSFDKMAKGLFREFYQWGRGGENSNVHQNSGNYITCLFFPSGTMQNLRIFTNSLLSFYYLTPILARMLDKHKDLFFSFFGEESKHEEDFDVYLLPYRLPKKDFIELKLAEGKSFLYAHHSYIDRLGTPKKLADLDQHLLIRSKDSISASAIGVHKFGTIKEYLPTLYNRRYIEVESLNSLLSLAKMGSGIVALADITHSVTKCNLQKISPLEEEKEFVYRDFTFGFHQRHKDNPLLQDIEKSLRIMFSELKLAR